MVIMVITLNIALASLCLGIVWKLRRIERSLKRTTRWLTNAERNTDLVLHSAPNYILLGQLGAQYGRKQMTGLGTMQQQIVHLAALLQLIQWMSQRQIRPIPRSLTSSIKRR
jgi:hypothetical protein